MQPARPHRHADGAGSAHPAGGEPLRGSNRGLTFNHTLQAWRTDNALATGVSAS